MNRIYRPVWNAESRQYVPAPESARSRGKRGGRGATTVVLLGGLLAGAFALPAAAGSLAPDTLPTGGQLVAGQAQIEQSASQMTIRQATDKAILHWQGFDIGSQAGVTFQQPSASAVALNRVLAGDASRIEGALNANGQVWLINPNGVIFGQGARVDVGGLVASTLDTSDEDFLAGRKRFTRSGATGAVENYGEITAAGGGLVALLAPTVRNEGVIRARLGQVVMAAGDAATLATGADGHLQIDLHPATVQTLIENRQMIIADGGEVVMTSAAADALSSGVVANEGTVQARTVQEKDGRILLLADMRHGETRAAGNLQAKFIETSAAQVELDQDLNVDSQGGEWLIDPTDITIDGAKAAAIQTALGSGNVTVTTADSGNNTGWGGGSNPGAGGDPGDIHVNAGISWSQHLLTLNADRDIHINATLNASNTAGLALEYGQGAVNAGNTSDYRIHAPVNLAGTGSFSTKLGSDGVTLPYTIITALGSATDNSAGGNNTLQGLAHASMQGGNYVLGADIAAATTAGWNAGAGFAPIGDFTTKYSGRFDGLGHTISGLSINRPGVQAIGLFGWTAPSSAILHLGVANADVRSMNATGILVGVAEGLISRAWSSGTLQITGQGGGGLVGSNDGIIEDSFSLANVTGGTDIGGLVGYDYDTIRRSYATGSVTGTQAAGGLVGTILGTIFGSYATGSVSVSSWGGGGLVGYRISGSASNSFWDTQTSGQVSSAVGSGLTTAQMKQQASFTGWDFTNAWRIYENDSYPVLRDLQRPTIVTANNDTRSYDGSAYTGNNGYTAAGATLTGTPTWGGTSQGAINAGNYPIGISGLSTSYTTQADYQKWGDILYNDGVLSVTPAALTITASNASKSYGQSLSFSGSEFSSSGLQNGETIGSVSLASAGAAAGAAASGSPYAITASAASGGTFSAGNYNITYANGSLTVTPAALTITASNASKSYDGNAWSGGNGVSYTGFANGEGVAVLSGSLSYGGNSQGAIDAGSYLITPQGLTAPNYHLIFVDGTLTILPVSSPYSLGAARIDSVNRDLFALGGGQGAFSAETFARGFRSSIPYLSEEEDAVPIR